MGLEQVQAFFIQNFGVGLMNLLAAIGILILGYIVARILGGLTRRLLNKVQVDDKVTNRLSKDFDLPQVDAENVVASIVFWVVILFFIVAAIQQLNMAVITAAINPLLTIITTDYIPGIIGAVVLGLVAWVVAVILRAIVVKLCKMLKLDARLTKHGAITDDEQVSITDTLGTLTFWLVILLFIPSILNALGISAIAIPFTQAITAFFEYLPNIVSAVVIFLVGWLMARVLRQLVTSLLTAVKVVDSVGSKVGLTGEQTLSKLLGTLTYVTIMLMVLIAALDALSIAAISGPATAMLNTIMNALPAFIGAILVLVIAYFIAKLVSQLIVEVLTGLKFDEWPAKLGINYTGTQSPSQLVGYIIMVGIILFAAVGASDLLQSQAISLIMTQIIDFFFSAVLALVIMGIGLYIANLVQKIVKSAAGANGRFLGSVARLIIIILAAAMALGQLGLAENIVNMAFGITLAAVAIAAALAFGLGSREIAGREVDQLLSNWRAGQVVEVKAETTTTDEVSATE
ncbi:MAG: mechanosensitive ion channel [Anaerolineae bacterium]|nr:mechanosensitive ion channel [Anaerolineae bacterium]